MSRSNFKVHFDANASPLINVTKRNKTCLRGMERNCASELFHQIILKQKSFKEQLFPS